LEEKFETSERQGHHHAREPKSGDWKRFETSERQGHHRAREPKSGTGHGIGGEWIQRSASSPPSAYHQQATPLVLATLLSRAQEQHNTELSVAPFSRKESNQRRRRVCVITTIERQKNRA
jgi:hypothetical protein